MICSVCGSYAREDSEDELCCLCRYKQRLNDFYRGKYGGLNITDIMDGEMQGSGCQEK